MIEQFVCLSGLPRTGSTLLSAILSQNPLIHAEGNSAVCQLMWDMQQSSTTSASQQLLANRRYSTSDDLCAAIPAIYYKDAKKPVIIDKCRSWTMPANLEMLQRYITASPRIIVLERPVPEIVDSFVRLRKANGWTEDLKRGLLDEKSEPIMRSIEGVKFARKSNADWFLFLTYQQLTTDTQGTLGKIYKFCGWHPFKHDLNNIVNNYPEDDEIYGLKGQHDVRSTISPRLAGESLNEMA
jgi:sulfotransferase